MKCYVSVGRSRLNSLPATHMLYTGPVASRLFFLSAKLLHRTFNGGFFANEIIYVYQITFKLNHFILYYIMLYYIIIAWF